MLLGKEVVVYTVNNNKTKTKYVTQCLGFIVTIIKCNKTLFSKRDTMCCCPLCV